MASKRLELLSRVHGTRAVVMVTPPVTSLELRRKATPYCSKLAWCCSKPMTRAGLTVHPFWLPLICCGGRPATGEVMILQRVLLSTCNCMLTAHPWACAGRWERPMMTCLPPACRRRSVARKFALGIAVLSAPGARLYVSGMHVAVWAGASVASSDCCSCGCPADGLALPLEIAWGGAHVRAFPMPATQCFSLAGRPTAAPCPFPSRPDVHAMAGDSFLQFSAMPGVAGRHGLSQFYARPGEAWSCTLPMFIRPRVRAACGGVPCNDFAMNGPEHCCTAVTSAAEWRCSNGTSKRCSLCRMRLGHACWGPAAPLSRL